MKFKNVSKIYVAWQENIKPEKEGAGSRNIPFGQKLVTGNCVWCGKQAKYNVLWGKSY